MRTQEKEELLDTVNKMKAKLEKESAALYETKQQMNEMNRHIEELKAQVSEPKLCQLPKSFLK